MGRVCWHSAVSEGPGTPLRCSSWVALHKHLQVVGSSWKQGWEGKGAGALAAGWRGFSVSFRFEWAVQLDTGESYGMNGLSVSQLAHVFWECSIHLDTSP